jgi:hypothetical protein
MNIGYSDLSLWSLLNDSLEYRILWYIQLTSNGVRELTLGLTLSCSFSLP